MPRTKATARKMGPVNGPLTKYQMKKAKYEKKQLGPVTREDDLKQKMDNEFQGAYDATYKLWRQQGNNIASMKMASIITSDKVAELAAMYPMEWCCHRIIADAGTACGAGDFEKSNALQFIARVRAMAVVRSWQM
jgi:hypothetical protein